MAGGGRGYESGRGQAGITGEQQLPGTLHTSYLPHTAETGLSPGKHFTALGYLQFFCSPGFEVLVVCSESDFPLCAAAPAVRPPGMAAVARPSAAPGQGAALIHTAQPGTERESCGTESEHTIIL